MIKVDRIIKQSWRILWSYRTLWIFGLLLALTGGGAGVNLNYNLNDRKTTSAPMPSIQLPDWAQEPNQWFQKNVNPLFEHPEAYVATFVLIGLGLLLLCVVIGLFAALVRYPAETAIIRMVDEAEQTGSKVGFRAGWQLGWSRRAFRIWVIDLIMGAPVVMIVLAMIKLGLLVYSTVTAGDQMPGILLGSLPAVSLFVLLLLVMLAWCVFVSLLRNLFIRAAALENLGVRDSLRSGWALFRKQWKNAGLVWLVMIGVGLVFGVLAIVLAVILIPAYLVLLIPASLLAALPGLLAYVIANQFAGGALVWIIAIVAALPVFFIVLFSPLILVSGWYRIFEANVWTLTYREVKAQAEPVLPDATNA